MFSEQLVAPGKVTLLPYHGKFIQTETKMVNTFKKFCDQVLNSNQEVSNRMGGAEQHVSTSLLVSEMSIERLHRKKGLKRGGGLKLATECTADGRVES